MEYAKLEASTLKHIDNTYYYGAYCRRCQHAARINLGKLRVHFGEEFPLNKIRERLKCVKCGNRTEITVTFLTPAQRSGSLVHLFAQVPVDR